MTKCNKLSEAMREGALQYPQCRNAPIKWWAGQRTYAVCALGAAAVAVNPKLVALKPANNTIDMTIYDSVFIWELLCREFDIDETVEVIHPHKGYSQRLCDTITNLNDSWFETIEKIADWLEEEGY